MNKYVNRLLNNYLPSDENGIIDIKITNLAIERTENCFTNIHRKYYNENGKIRFNHLNSDHMVNFLWFMANSLSQVDRIYEAEKLSYLNKIMHSIDAWHNISLPDVFLVVHPLGTVLGNAKYENFLVVYQNVTVGATTENKYPKFYGPSVLYSKASVIGDCAIGENVVLAANSLAINQDIKMNSIYIGNPSRNEIKSNSLNIRDYIFGQNKQKKLDSKNDLIG
jgi:serine O-acetyltransferase